MKTKLFLGTVLLILTSTVVAQQGNELLIYYAPIDYRDSTYRDEGKITGIYGAFRPEPGYVWEGAVENINLSYQSLDDLDQTDITLAFTRQKQNRHAYRMGFHSISTTHIETDSSVTWFAGFNRYHPYDDLYGGTLYYTRHPDSDRQVWQFVPKVQKYLGDIITTGTFLIEGKLNLINVLEEGNSDTYFSAEGDITWYYRSFQLMVGAWAGEQIYAVRNDGFTVYNLPYKHTGGFKFQAGYAVTNNTSIKLGIAQELVTETDGVKSDVTIYMLSLGYTF
ncbi:MAG: hypothetical protein DRR19_17410 [Candidatus Parabeggiatoa sp. nov. 1]|nr:MAG: hypothetical protein DRR19_17410 [Gammaproteobacteria bacterium]HEC85571.1 hypothetical protein [Thioploca sp.]